MTLPLTPSQTAGPFFAIGLPGQPGEFRFDIRLQGRQETVFFEV